MHTSDKRSVVFNLCRKWDILVCNLGEKIGNLECAKECKCIPQFKVRD